MVMQQLGKMQLLMAPSFYVHGFKECVPFYVDQILTFSLGAVFQIYNWQKK